MAQAQINWRGERFITRRVVPLLRTRMDVAGRVVASQIRQRVATPYPPASRPGRPPHRRTGRLMRSIRHEMRVSRRSVSVRIRARVHYASFLQRGTRKMVKRPFLYLTRSQAVRFVRALGR